MGKNCQRKTSHSQCSRDGGSHVSMSAMVHLVVEWESWGENWTFVHGESVTSSFTLLQNRPLFFILV